MNIEYFADGSRDCPLILLYGDDPIGVHDLCRAIERLIDAERDTIAIYELPGCISIHGCQLVASRTRTDKGVYLMRDGLRFAWSLQKETWEEIIGLLEPFTIPQRDAIAHVQYVDETTDISVLISTTRSW